MPEGSPPEVTPQAHQSENGEREIGVSFRTILNKFQDTRDTWLDAVNADRRFPINGDPEERARIEGRSDDLSRQVQDENEQTLAARIILFGQPSFGVSLPPAELEKSAAKLPLDEALRKLEEVIEDPGEISGRFNKDELKIIKRGALLLRTTLSEAIGQSEHTAESTEPRNEQ
jgi:hypothetical protein